METEAEKLKAVEELAAKKLAAKEEADKTEQARLDEIERKRVEDKKHQKEIETIVLDNLNDYIDDPIISLDILNAIKADKIDYVTIIY